MAQDIRTTLTISQQEAYEGTVRMLTLPDGRQNSVTIPPGAYQGQALSIPIPAADGQGLPVTLILTLNIQQTAEQGSSTSEYTMTQVTDSTPSNSQIGQPATSYAAPMPGTELASTMRAEDETANSLSSTPPPPPPSEQWQSSYSGNPNAGASSPYTQTPPFYGTPTMQQPGSYTQYPNNQYPSLPGQPQPPRPTGNNNPRSNLILILVLVVVIIAGSGITFFAINSVQTRTSNESNTATALANQGNETAIPTSTSQNNGSETADAQSTVDAENEAATATAQAQSTAEVQTNNPNPYLPGEGTLLYHDPLDSNSNLWDIEKDECSFKDKAFYIIDNNNEGKAAGCYFAGDSGYDKFKNFTVEVTMTVIQGDAGGISFRVTDSGGYTLYFDHEGYAQLLAWGDSSSSTTISSSDAASAHLGRGQENTVGLVVQGNTISWFVNSQLVGTIDDNTVTGSGYLSLLAGSYSENPETVTEIAFKNFKIWEI